MELLKRVLLAIVLLSPSLAAEDIVVGKFGGLSTKYSPMVIDSAKAQDLLNVRLATGGKSVKKREGVASAFTLNWSSAAVHGGYKFQDTSGNDVQIWGNGGNLNIIKNRGSPLLLVGGFTVGATWDCTDTQGSAYCVNSARDGLVKTDGITYTSYTWANGIPQGSIIDSTPDRLLISGTTNYGNIYYSASGDFLDFSIGTTDTSASYEPITSPGSRITGLLYSNSRWYWWKDQSFGFILGDNYTNLEVQAVSGIVGTLDNSAVEWNGLVYFRGQDNHFYSFDGSVLTKMSDDIAPTIASANRRKFNQWEQTNQADFVLGTLNAVGGSLSSSIVPGSVVPSSFTMTDSASVDFTSGTAYQMSTSNNYLILALSSGVNINNGSFDLGTGSDASNWTEGSGWARNVAGGVTTTNCGSWSPDTGTGMMTRENTSPASSVLVAEVLNPAGTVTYAQTQYTYADSRCSWQSASFAHAVPARTRVKVRFTYNGQSVTSDSFIMNSTVSTLGLRFMSDCYGTGCNTKVWGIDNVETDQSTFLYGTFTSRTFDTGVTSAYTKIGYDVTSNGFTPFVEYQDSSDGSAWGRHDLVVDTTYNTKRYVRYLSSFTVGANDNALSTLDTVITVARSSGSYYSPVHSISSATSWSNFSVIDDVSQGGSIAYFIRSSTAPIYVLCSTPAWTAISKDTLISIPIQSYVQVRADFSIVKATNQPTVNDLIVGWYEGLASDKAYVAYFDNAIWWAVSQGTATSNNNRIYLWDLNNNEWLVDDIQANGLVTDNLSLYIGSPSTGTILKYGSVYSDGGASINSYWKSKDFPDDPWQDKEFNKIDFVAVASSGTSMTVTYKMNTSSGTSYSINLFGNGDSIVRSSKNLPIGKYGGLFNIQFGDYSSNNPWETLGLRATYRGFPWKPR